MPLQYGRKNYPCWRQGESCTKNRLISINMISGCGTVSDRAPLVFAGSILIDILAVEMKRIYFRCQIVDIQTEKLRTFMSKCHSRWEQAFKERWTFRLFPHLTQWMEKGHELNFYMIEFQTCHDCFSQYLLKSEQAKSPTCPNCIDVNENAEHVIFSCPKLRWPQETDSRPDPQFDVISNTADQRSKYDQCMFELMSKLRRLEKWRRNLT